MNMTKEEFLADINASYHHTTAKANGVPLEEIFTNWSSGAPIDAMYYLIDYFNFVNKNNPFMVIERRCDGGIQEFDLCYKLGELIIFIKAIQHGNFTFPKNIEQLAEYLHIQEKKIMILLEKYNMDRRLEKLNNS